MPIVLRLNFLNIHTYKKRSKTEKLSHFLLGGPKSGTFEKKPKSTNMYAMKQFFHRWNVWDLLCLKF